ncbi:hypothetical protein PV327_009148 [Microctonus hyperodae]|uniref:Uncharacterized protein n=1 Tax=Microctonus hyperodae TaxID=165561 RepID=A0AA39FT62_MICHY|nr:hypothetical protein PV327_009148 [Microctonus hyperodae]
MRCRLRDPSCGVYNGEKGPNENILTGGRGEDRWSMFSPSTPNVASARIKRLGGLLIAWYDILLSFNGIQHISNSKIVHLHEKKKETAYSFQQIGRSSPKCYTAVLEQ